MSSFREVQLHGTGHTVGEVIDAAVTAASGTPPASIVGAAGGDVNITAADATGSGTPGSVHIQAGYNGDSGDRGVFTLNNLGASDPHVDEAIWSDNGTIVQSGSRAPSGTGTGFTVTGYNYTVAASAPNAGGNAGNVTVTAGSAFSGATGTGGTLQLTAGEGRNAKGGSINLSAGPATLAGDGGDIVLTPGGVFDSGTGGLVKIINLPTSDPHVANALWKNSGVLTVSAG